MNHIYAGDNLSVLPLLIKEFKCIFLDPPYNTGGKFNHYSDRLSSVEWLDFMRKRLELLPRLMSEDGTLWITIDDREVHYLKVLCDEIFGRSNFVANIVWQNAYTANQTAKHISRTHTHILVYANNYEKCKLSKLPRTGEQKKKFKNPDNDPRGPWVAEKLDSGGKYVRFPITGPKGQIILPPPNRYWRCSEATFKKWEEDGRIIYTQNGEGRPYLKKFLNEMGGLLATTWWPYSEVGGTVEAVTSLKRTVQSSIPFDTPKPERLLKRILELATQPGDSVLDIFAGSGTTAVVADQLGRKWTLIEQGSSLQEVILPRLAGRSFELHD